MKLPLPKYGLDKLYLFPVFQTAEEYKRATGAEPPAWDPTRPPKAWADPSAALSNRRNVSYENALAVAENGQPLIDEAGRPYLDVLVLSRIHAATVNIPPKGAGTTNTPGADQPEVPVPCRALDPAEELAFGFGGVVEVRNVELYGQLVADGVFTARDRALLEGIARKLGVL